MSDFMGNKFDEGDGHSFFVSYDKDAKPYLAVEPGIEYITKQGVVNYYKEFLSRKPKQLKVGEYKHVDCESCEFEGVVDIKQDFCPVCLQSSLADTDIDVDKQGGVLLQKWAEEKNMIERLVTGKIIEFVENHNNNPNSDDDDDDDYIGEEVIVDEDD